MRHTPLDGPDAGRREGGERNPTGEEPADQPRGFVGRLREVLDQIGDAVRRLVESDESSGSAEHTEGSDRGEETVSLVEREPAQKKPVVVDRAEDDQKPSVSRRGPLDRPELVARWHDDRLTLSEPDEPGAKMSSDVWSEVEP